MPNSSELASDTHVAVFPFLSLSFFVPVVISALDMLGVSFVASAGSGL